MLYFDDVLGLYRAGVTAESDLTLADVLRTHVQRREVRVLAEMTPEMFRAFTERDRGLADQFHVLPVEPLQATETLHALLAVRRRLEIKHRCSFDVDVLPAVIEVQRRYVRDAEFPGKGAAFLNQLALTHPRATVTRDTVYEQFHEQTGLALILLDGRHKLPRADVLRQLRRRVVGQDAALEALTDVVSVAKARLNAVDRPLATLLFMGPTGVGKTQCAKALATFLFGRDEHLVRLDMNEFNSPTAASRLIGTFLEPEGLLTAPVRRQPFCVVLLDEIEKAHPAVFDMLLQVMGEGRLTDAVGRTTDFSSAIVIMTSNLGTREVAAKIGFGVREEDRRRAFVGAAEAFFRPEFVNRIDRIIPFAQLSRQEMRSIAELLLDEVVGREGLVRRRCALNVDSRAVDVVVDKGYDPKLGARALKRTIERQLIQPVSARLATLKPEQPVVIDVRAARGGIVVRVSALTEVEPVRRNTLPAAPEEARGRLEAVLAKVEGEIRENRPRGEIRSEALTPAQHDYLEISAVIEGIRKDIGNAMDRYGVGGDDGAAADVVADYLVRRPGRLARRVQQLVYYSSRFEAAWRFFGKFLPELARASDMHAWLRDLHAVSESMPDAELASLRNRTALLFAAVHGAGLQSSGAVLFVRGWGSAAEAYARRLADLYRCMSGGDPFGSDDRMDDGPRAKEGDSTGRSSHIVGHTFKPLLETEEQVTFLVMEGASAGPLVRNEVGTHLMVHGQGSLIPIQVGMLPPGGPNDEGRGTGALRRRFDDTQRAWLDGVDRGEATLDEDPFPPGSVVRIYDERTATVDLRTRLSVAGWPEAGDIWTFVGAGLPLGDESE